MRDVPLETLMAVKIVLNPILGSYASVAALNNRFNLIENAFNESVLWRGNPVGQANVMSNDLDMGGYAIVNASILNISGTLGVSIQNGIDWAREWADKGENLLVSLAAGGDEVTDYSSLHWAAKANASSISAAANVVSTQSLYDNFDSRYLGAFTTAAEPLLDNKGNALVAGALYFNITTDIMMVRTSGGAWITINSVPTSAASVTVADAKDVLIGTSVEAALYEGMSLKCRTAQGFVFTEDGSNTWSNIATFTEQGQYRIRVSSCEIGNTVPIFATINVFIATGGGNYSTVNTKIDVLENGATSVIANSSFKLTADSLVSTSSIKLWMKKTTLFNRFYVHEISRALDPVATAVYNANSAWQSATPTGSALNITSALVLSATGVDSPVEIAVSIQTILSGAWTTVVANAAAKFAFVAVKSSGIFGAAGGTVNVYARKKGLAGNAADTWLLCQANGNTGTGNETITDRSSGFVECDSSGQYEVYAYSTGTPAGPTAFYKTQGWLK